MKVTAVSVAVIEAVAALPLPRPEPGTAVVVSPGKSGVAGVSWRGKSATIVAPEHVGASDEHSYFMEYETSAPDGDVAVVGSTEMVKLGALASAAIAVVGKTTAYVISVEITMSAARTSVRLPPRSCPIATFSRRMTSSTFLPSDEVEAIVAKNEAQHISKMCFQL